MRGPRRASVVALVVLAFLTALAARSPEPPRVIPAHALRTFEVPPALVRPGSPLTVDGGAAWYFSSADELRRVDLTTGSATQLAVPYGPMTRSDDGVWTISGACPRTLRLLRVESGEVARTFDLDVPCATGVGADPILAAGGQWVWMLLGFTLFRVDGATGTTTPIQLPSGPSGGRSGDLSAALAADARGVWQAHAEHVTHVDGATATIDSDATVRGAMARMSIVSGFLADGDLWCTAYEISSSIRILTARVESDGKTGRPTLPVLLATAAPGHFWYAGYFPRGLPTNAIEWTWQVGRFDQRTGRRITRTDFVVASGTTPQIGATADALWILSGGQLTRVPARR